MKKIKEDVDGKEYSIHATSQFRPLQDLKTQTL